MSLTDDVAELLRKQREEEFFGPPVIPQWTGDLAKWIADWVTYWGARRHDVFSRWFELLRRVDPATGQPNPPTSDEIATGRELLHTELDQLDLDNAVWPQPFLLGLAARWNDKTPGAPRLSGDPGQSKENYDVPLGWVWITRPSGDYAVAEFENRLMPKTRLGKDRKPVAGQTGFSVSDPIDRFERLDQVYVSAKAGYTRYGDMERLLTMCTPEEVAEAEMLCDQYRNYDPPEAKLNLPMLGLPDGYHNLALASYQMNDEQYQRAAAWLTLEHMRPLIEPDKPMPWKTGWIPPLPLGKKMKRDYYAPSRQWLNQSRDKAPKKKKH